MRFFNPLALAGLALLLLPIAIHLLVRQRALRRDFPSLSFLRPTKSFRLRPRRIQQPLLLALRLLALSLLIVGLAQPWLTRATGSGKATVILLDASFSMKMGRRLPAARAQARTVIDRMAPGDRAAIVTFNGTAQVIVPLTHDKTALVKAIDGYSATDGLANYAGAIRAGEDLLETNGEASGEILIVSDFQTGGLNDKADLHRALDRSNRHILTLPAGASIGSNVHWVDLNATRSPEGVLVSASLVTREGESVAAERKQWRLDSPEGNQPGIEWRTETNGQITGRLVSTQPDEFTGDDQLDFSITPGRPRVSLLIADQTDATVYLKAGLGAALRSDPEVQTSLPGPEGLDQYQTVTLVLHGQPDPWLLPRLSEYAKRGGTVWLLAGADLSTDTWNRAQVGLPQLARLPSGPAWRLRVSDPLAGSVMALTSSDRRSLLYVPIQSGYAITPTAGSEVVMRWSNGSAAMVRIAQGAGAILLVGTSPERAASGLGLSTAFPQLARSIMQAATPPTRASNYSIGEMGGMGRLPTGTVEITRPNGAALKVDARDLVSAPAEVFAERGIYQLAMPGQVQFLAVNPSAEESDPTVMDASVIKRIFSGDPAAPAWSGARPPANPVSASNLWRYLMALGLVLLLVELFASRGRRANQATKGPIPAA